MLRNLVWTVPYSSYVEGKHMGTKVLRALIKHVVYTTGRARFGCLPDDGTVKQ